MWDILYVVDASSSMAEAYGAKGESFVKMESVKRSLEELIRQKAFPFGSRVGLITFNARTRAGGMFLAGDQEMVREIVPLADAGSMGRDALDAQLAKIEVSGATPTGEGIEGGLKALYAADDGPVKRIKKLVVITDERSNVGPKPEKVVNDEVAAKAIIDIIAVGGKVNRGAYEKVAAKTGGRFAVVEGAGSLFDAMSPAMEKVGLGDDRALLEEAAKAAQRLEASRKSGTNSMEYRQALEWARMTRARVNKRLMEVLILKEGSEKIVKELAAQAQAGLPMKDYAAEVWPKASQMEQIREVESRLKGAMEKLAE